MEDVYRYIGFITDQSNWSGPFSLVVMTPYFESEGGGFKPRSGHSNGSFYLQVYFFSYYIGIAGIKMIPRNDTIINVFFFFFF